MRINKKIVVLLCEIISLLFLAILIFPPTTGGILLGLVGGSGLCLVNYVVVRAKRNRKIIKNWNLDLFFIGLLLLLIIQFANKWNVSSIINSIARLLHIKTDVFLIIIAAICGVVSFLGRNIFFRIVFPFLQDKRYNPVLSLLVFMLEFVQFQYSSLGMSLSPFSCSIIVFILNILAIASLSLIFNIAFCNWRNSLRVSSIICTIWSVANFYVIQYHGSPLFFSELRNAGTAFAVATGYTFFVSFDLIACIFIGFMEVGLSNLLVIHDSTSLGRHYGRKLIHVCFIISILLGVYKLSNTNYFKWNWMEAVKTGGFSICNIQDTERMIWPCIKPDGYSEDGIRAMDVVKNRKSSTVGFPDIILILNETLYDLNELELVNSDIQYLSDLYCIDGLKYGHAIVPSVGGGTNSSEFELLTSNSMYLLQASAPFNYIDFESSCCSAVQFLKSLGYHTTAMHCCNGSNYSRNKAYPAMGFDNVLLGEDFFTYNKNGNRDWLDKDNYCDLIRLYENDSQNGTHPNFYYLLTYQNHGGYQQNENELDTIHCTDDLGILTDEVNEYMSSAVLSSKAFLELTQYFSTNNRPVLICMVGDHAPAFVSNLQGNRQYSEIEKEVIYRSVPYVVWSNADFDLTSFIGNVSMVDIVPLLIKTANLPLSTFYRVIIELHEIFPIRTSNGIFIDSSGKIDYFENCDKENIEILDDYYFLEYNALAGGKNYRRELFFPY